MWFQKKILDRISMPQLITLNELRGFVLPHAGVEHTWPVLAHTFRFQPSYQVTEVLIFYLPASAEPDVKNEFHEFFVVRKVCEYFMRKWWGIRARIRFIGVNIANIANIASISYNSLSPTSFVVISSDFSHFLDMSDAISLENRAAHALEFKQFKHPTVRHVVDDGRTFSYVFNHVLPSNFNLQWVGRSRSASQKGVGYLSFLIIDSSVPIDDSPVGAFVTCFDVNMNARECLGVWFNNQDDAHEAVHRLFNDVVQKASTTSRLTGGRFLEVPVKFCTVTYLFPEDSRNFVRGWHGVRGVRTRAFYLPEVFLEHTFENGHWIEPENKEWPRVQSLDQFDFQPTFEQLSSKASKASKENDVELFRSVSRYLIL